MFVGQRRRVESPVRVGYILKAPLDWLLVHKHQHRASRICFVCGHNHNIGCCAQPLPLSTQNPLHSQPCAIGCGQVAAESFPPSWQGVTSSETITSGKQVIVII